MSSHQITAIRKPNRDSSHEHITHVKYDGYIHLVEEVINGIFRRTDSFFVKVDGSTAWVEVVPASAFRRTYIRTRPDWTGKDNLLSLPEC
jgi:hypothetical protein